MTYSSMLYRLNLFLWAIAVSDFCSLEIYKNLGVPLSIITFIVNSHEDNHFYKCIYLFQILSQLFYFKCERQLWFFPIKTMVYLKTLYRRKKFFSVDYVKLLNYNMQAE